VIIGKWKFVWFPARTEILAPSIVENLNNKLPNYEISQDGVSQTSQGC
ncbi:unnamed protein product, partial [Rotaria magnacalcarata]